MVRFPLLIWATATAGFGLLVTPAHAQTAPESDDAEIRATPEEPAATPSEAGKPAEALGPLRRATELSGNQPLIATTFGHALIATEDKAHFAEAERVLKTAVARDRENPFAWYQLGTVYAAKGDLPRAKLASAEQQVMSGQMRQALSSAEAAQNDLPRGSPDWLRAQDIAFQARAVIERGRKKR